jgi:formate dehydrogenase iron-sulfur subunit
MSASATETGFFTDSTLCIGCKACEVACKEWNDVPSDGFTFSGKSYDNTLGLGHSTWRHVKFVEHDTAIGAGGNAPHVMTWQFSSDVCKDCEVAGCLEACPTGFVIRTEFGGVYIQPDICNGCGYCVVTCSFGVVDRRPTDGRAFKCTCYDRQKDGLQPACATACPTGSILFGDLEEMTSRRRAHRPTPRRRHADTKIWNPTDTSIGGTPSIFLVHGDAVQPAAPEEPTTLLKPARSSTAAAAGGCCSPGLWRSGWAGGGALPLVHVEHRPVTPEVAGFEQAGIRSSPTSAQRPYHLQVCASSLARSRSSAVSLPPRKRRNTRSWPSGTAPCRNSPSRR